ncbi:phage/plasmid primase, P4 family [Dermacoccus sp. BD5]|uniref:DNA primase family protein n=1 Tax=Dermacoccus sp. BD5 TaxID=2953656 RepID=UPI0038456076
MTAESMPADAYDENGVLVSQDGEKHSGQVRIAYRLARAARGRLMHVHGVGWLHYDGARWCEDVRGIARREVLEVLRDALAESLGGDAALRRDVAKCESAAGIAGVLDIAASLVEFAATVEDLDADPYLVNTPAGTLDLQTGTVRAHDADDRLTKVTRGNYVPGHEPGAWATFLEQVLPDADERAYLARLVGQALYGRVTENVFPVLTGTGANGKSTATTALAFALGDYVTAIDPALLMVQDRARSGSTELMQLLGTRLVIGQETDEGRKLDEATMKRLTGGDVLTARRLYRDPVSWVPTHTLVYVSNHLPAVKGNDPATWRRMRVVPFNIVVPPDKRDGRLGERLELAADEVVSWAVDGYRDYLEGGMREPASVLRATDAYKAESDHVRQFIDDACEAGPNAVATSRQLYGAWQAWAMRNGAEAKTEKAFGAELDRLGYPARRTKNGALRDGLAPLDLAGF